MKIKNAVIKNKFGYFEVVDKPSEEELLKYYSEKYFQNQKGSYEKEYSKNEISFFNNKIAQKYAIVKSLLEQKKSYSLLDVGCGEGWALSYFKSIDWNVTGVDYSNFGCETFNPHVLSNLITGNVYEKLNELISYSNIQYDLIWLTNVLEHVINPEALIDSLKSLIKPNGIVLIQVPNDFSYIQEKLEVNNYISKPYWLAIPDHLSYFTNEGLINLMDSKGFHAEHMSTDFPIDFNLFNADTNYVENSGKGKNVHMSRVEIENMFHEISVDKTNKLYEVLASMGLGREIIGFFKLK